MGTNYYASMSIHGIPIDLHIGKSSGGWKFMFSTYDRLETSRQWLELLAKPDVKISDEYGQDLSYDTFKQNLSLEGWDYLTAPQSAWHGSVEERSRFERLDDDGYRFAICDPEDWS